MSSEKDVKEDSRMDLDPEIEKQLREAAEREEQQISQEIKDKCQQEFNKRASLMAEQFLEQFNSQMSNVGDRYTHHTHEKITVRQTNVLRTNKAIRDVSRDLGDDWRPVFQHLMKDSPADKVKVEMARIERQKPFLQALKALNTWKDSMGDTFDIRQLVDALMTVERRDLAEKVLDILDDNQLDNLYTLENVGKGFAGGAAKQVAGKSEGDGADKKTNPPKSSTPREDPIGDSKLLKIAKELGKDWLPLAEALKLSEEDIEETKTMPGGDSYHGGFKCLFLWRDYCVENGKLTAECGTELRGVLNKIGRKELAETIPNSS
ncbi:hypothetical protein LSH36_535g02045 [Paralvinella palmiformis]|uniref:Death domain-containing protein n=1 Tax=Paralvinella palmiformis TaxID=53620 RepID=A0AAD9J7C3_9ANNE|nr:hypothetical protein LSH36_535g02045 [Paralvinella palmiformis]